MVDRIPWITVNIYEWFEQTFALMVGGEGSEALSADKCEKWRG